MKLNFKVFGEGSPVIILHGLFGMLDNWQQFAKQLATSHTVYILDLRNHGRSSHSDIFNYDVMSDDLVTFININHINNTSIIGHSMGGKLALKFASLHQSLVNKTIVIDIGIKKYNASHKSILAALNSLDLNTFINRESIDNTLMDMIPNRSVRQFLLKNIARNKATTGYHWKMNISSITKSYTKIIDRVDFPTVFSGECLFIKGENSDYIIDKDIEDILSFIPKARFTTIPRSGHWVHSEQPQLLINIIKKELSQ